MLHPNYFVSIAGNIGVGKSSLTARLAERFDWRPCYEPVDENPYLADFYHDMRRWSFQSQIFFLTRQLQFYPQLRDLRQTGSVLKDRTVYEDAEIFAANLYRQGHMSDRDWQAYQDLYSALADLLPPPDLIVYLRASVPTLMARIAKRGRDYERSVDPTYIVQLQDLYDSWAERFRACPILVVNTDHLEFVETPGGLDAIADLIAETLHRHE